MENQIQYYFTSINNKVLYTGIISIAFVFISIVVSMFCIKYPVFITSEIILETETYHEEIKAINSGKISDIFFENNQTIKKGDIIGYINVYYDSNLYHELKDNLNELEDSLIKIRNKEYDYLLLENNSKDIAKLQEITGSMSLDFEELFITYYKLLDLTSSSNLNQTLDLLDNQIESLTVLLGIKKEIENVKQRNWEINRNNFNIKSELINSGNISDYEISNQESVVNSSRSELLYEKYNVIEQKIKIDELKREKINHLSAIKREQRQLFLVLNREIILAKSKLTDWENNHLIKATIDGTLNYINFRGVNQYVDEGDVLFAVVPESLSVLIGKMILPVNKAIRVKEGTMVNIQLQKYPKLKYGTLPGTVASKSLVYNDGNYIVYVEIDKTLITTSGVKIEFEREMIGIADIMLEKEVLFNKIIKNYDLDNKEV